MDYKMLGDTLPAVEIRLQAGKAMYAQSGGMVWISDGFILDSNIRGGFMKGLGRAFSDESLFTAAYTAPRPDSTIASASIVSGKILTIDTAKTSLVCQKGVFLRAQATIEINAVLTKRSTAGSLDGEGFILQQIQGSGVAFLEVDGDVVERVLALGEAIKVDTGDVFAFEPGIPYKIGAAKGVKNTLFGGEGLLPAKLTSPGKIYVQTMSTMELAGRTARGLLASKQ